MKSTRRLMIGLAACLALLAARPAGADEASARREYGEIRTKFTEEIKKAGAEKSEQKRAYLAAAKAFRELGMRHRTDTGNVALIDSVIMYKKGNDSSSAERTIREAKGRADKWEHKTYLLRASYENPNQMSLCQELAKKYLPEAEKDPRKANELIPFLQAFGMKREAEQLKASAPEKPKKAAPAKGDPGGQAIQLPKGGGEKARDFTGADRLSGKSITLSKLKGKVVLLDFWATWCRPCVASIPAIKGVYKDYSGKDFALIGISLDQDLGQMDAFVKSEGMPWPQIADGRGWNAAVAKLYGVHSIPHTVLIDKDGEIIAEDLDGKELRRAIEAALK